MNRLIKIIIAAQLPMLLSSFFYSGFGQDTTQDKSDEINSLPPDSLFFDNNAPTIIKDALVENATLYPILKNHGSIFNTKNEAFKIHKTEPQKINYISTQEVLYQKTNSQPLFTGAFGKRDKLGKFGYFHQGASMNGVQQFGVGNSSYNLWINSVESSENIEIYEGAEAIPFAVNTGGILTNFQEIGYNTEKPFVRLWGADINDDLLNFNGTWAQNFAPNWNFYTNYHSLSGNARYDNSDFRSRNLRIAFRNTLDSSSQITYTYLHSNNFITSNSGINPSLSLDVNGDFADSPVNSVVHFNSLNRRNKDHQIITHYSNVLDSARTSALNISGYARYSIIHENLGNLDFEEGLQIEKFDNYEVGGNGSFETRFSKFFLKGFGNISFNSFGANRNYSGIDYLNFSIGGYFSVNNENFKPYGSAKFSNYLGNRFLDFGGGIDMKFYELPLKLDYSFSNVSPSLYQGEARIEKHSLFFAKTKFDYSNTEFFFEAWNRVIVDQIIYGLTLTNNEIVRFDYLQNQTLNTSGLSSRIKFKAFDDLLFNFDDVYVDLKIVANPFVLEGSSPFPVFYSDLRSYITIPRGKSEANIGFTWKVSSSNNGYGYNEFYDIYYVDPYQELGVMLGNLEFFALLRLNHAWLKLSFVNPIGADIYYLSHHRALNQFFKMTFNWTVN